MPSNPLAWRRCRRRAPAQLAGARDAGNLLNQKAPQGLQPQRSLSLSGA